MSTLREPQTPEQWQIAVNLAKAYLSIAEARHYGLMTGGPVVDEGRCLDVLTRGAAAGWVPRRGDVDTMVDLIVRGYA